MKNELLKPYVVSADVEGLMQIWSRKTGFLLPNGEYFAGMSRDLQSILEGYFAAVDIIPEDFLKSGLKNLAKNSNKPVVSLDRAYVSISDSNIIGFLDITRAVDESLNSIGQISRNPSQGIEHQVNQISKRIGCEDINLLDDVIFEGKTMAIIIETFKKQGINVQTVIAGIAIKEGIILLEENGVSVDALLTYDQVVDEICERDFVVGSPLSGRTLNIKGKIFGAPYLYPFGKPIEWASIPKNKAIEFSLFCLSQSLKMWGNAERISQSSISTKSLAKPIFRLQENKSIVQALVKVRNQLVQGEFES